MTIGEAGESVNFQCKNVKRQYIAVFSATLITFAHGCAVGWITPVLPLLQSDDSPLESGPITVEQTSWIGALVCMGALSGAIVYGSISGLIGAKRTMILLAVPTVTFWLCIMFGSLVHHLYIARFIGGATGGGAQVCVPIFIAEIVENDIRGECGTYLGLARAVGGFVIFVAGAYLSYTILPYIFILAPVVYLICILLLPNTPQYLLRVGEVDAAEKSLKFYKGISKNETKEENEALRVEFERLRTIYKEVKKEEDFKLSDFCEVKARNGLMIALTMVLLTQLTGVFALNVYATNIFARSGTFLSPSTSTIIMGFVQILGTFGTTQLVDIVGRKTVLIISLVGVSLGNAILGTYLYLYDQGFDSTAFDWIPVTAVSFVIFTANFGIVPVSGLIMVEILPTKVRQFGVTVCTISLYLCAFFVLKFFPPLSYSLGLHGCMWIFSVCCTLGIFFIIFVLEETKGSSLEDDISHKSSQNVSSK